MQKILIAQPTTGTVVSGTVQYLMELGRTLSNERIDWDYRSLSLSDIALSRNIFASHVIADNEFSHILFIDTDMGFSAQTILRLIAFDKPIAAAVCPKRFLAWDRFREQVETDAAESGDRPSATQDLLDIAHSYNIDTRYSDGSAFSPTQDGGFMTVPAVGTGIMLIQRDVFEIMLAHGIARPRPGYRDLPMLGTSPLCDFFAPREAPDGSMFESEDISFCRRWVEDCGGQIWADIDSRIMHYGMRGHSGRYRPNAARDFALTKETAE